MTHYHFIGIGGTGLAPIARVLLERGHQISGSDKVLSPTAEALQIDGAKISIGHQKENVSDADVVIRSSAINDNNPEVIAANQAGIPVIKRRDLLPSLTSESYVIAVAGTHGKTTTTAMLAWCLSEIGEDPSYVIGGISNNLGKDAHAGNGRMFVIEADEYDQMFLGLSPDILIVTNIEHDHPDHYPTQVDYMGAFQQLVEKIKPGGKLIACLDDPGVQALFKTSDHQITRISYGLISPVDYQIKQIQHEPGCGVKFGLHHVDFTLEGIELKIPGNHNALNACAVLATIHQLQVEPIEKALAAISHYSGTSRRFEIKGQVNGITIIDDYAHHPSQIRSTIAATRCQFPENTIWAVWQPHTYSRTKALMDDYAESFKDSDHVIVTEVYAARENDPGYSAVQVVNKIDHKDARFIPSLNETAKFLIGNLKPGDILLVLSAGDAVHISQQVLDHLRGGT